MKIKLAWTCVVLMLAACRSLPWPPAEMSGVDEETRAIAEDFDVPVDAVPRIQARLSVDVSVFEPAWRTAYPGRYAGMWWDRSTGLPVLQVAFKGPVDPAPLKLAEVGVPVVVHAVTFSLEELEALKEDVIEVMANSEGLAGVVRSVGPALLRNGVVVALEDSDRGRVYGRELAGLFRDRGLIIEHTDVVFRF